MKIINLTKIYQIKNGEPVKALDDVSFDLPNKGMVFLLGKSGSGKTTLLNLLGGLDTFDGGDIVFGNKSLKNFTSSELDSFRNTCCGFVFQDYNLLPEFTVAENVALSLEIQSKQASKEEISQALKSVDLEGYENRKITELSGGQKQRISIVRALAKTPDVIFADEPTGALDSNTGDDILNLLKQLSKTKLVVVVSHDREFALKYADRIIELKNGKIISDTEKDFEEKQPKAWQMQKSGMPFKAAVKIGMSSFKLHPIKLVATVLLAVLTFVIFGTFLTATLTEQNVVTINSLADKGVNVAVYNKTVAIKDDGKMNAKFCNADLTVLSGQLNTDYAGLRKEEVFVDNYADIDAVDKTYYMVEPMYAALLNKKQAEALGFELIGRFPQNANEVAVSKLLAEKFVVTGVEQTEGAVYLTVFDDLIDKKVILDGKQYTVVGIVNTKLDGKFNTLKTEEEPTNAQMQEYALALTNNFHCAVFFDVAYFEVYETDFAVKDTQINVVNSHIQSSMNIKAVKAEENLPRDSFVSIDDDNDGVTLPIFYAYSVLRNFSCAVNYNQKNFSDFGSLFKEYAAVYRLSVLDEEYAAAKQNGYTGSKEQYGQLLDNLYNFYGKSGSQLNLTAFESFVETYQLPKVNVVVNMYGVGQDVNCYVCGFFATNDADTSAETMAAAKSVLNKMAKYYGGKFDAVYLEHQFKKYVDYDLAEIIDGDNVYTLSNDIAKTVKDISEKMSGIKKIFGIVTVPLAVLAVAMFYYFVSSSVNDKTYTIGVLRILGCKPKDVIKIFLTEALLVGLFTAILSVGAVFGVCGIVNGALNSNPMATFITLLQPSVAVCAIVLVGITLIAFLSTLFSTRSLLQTRPLDYLVN